MIIDKSDAFYLEEPQPFLDMHFLGCGIRFSRVLGEGALGLPLMLALICALQECMWIGSKVN